MGRLRMCDGSQYLQPWHPDAFQDTPRELTTVTTPNGVRQRLIGSAPGHLDSIMIYEGEK